MSKKPPHLPNPTCRVDTHTRLRSIFHTIVFTIIGFLAGLAATLTAFAWIIPYDVNLLAFQRPVRQVSLGVDNSFDTSMRHSVRQRMVTLYDGEKKLSAGLYREDGKLAHGLVLSSDGWIVLPYVEAVFTSGVSVEVIDHLGKVYDAKEVVADPLGQFLYMKINGQGMSVVEFEDFEEAITMKEFHVFDGAYWSDVVVSGLSLTSETGLMDAWKPGYDFRLLPEAKQNSFVYSQNGKFIGVVGERSNLIFADVVGKQLASLSVDGKIDMDILPVRGMFVSIHDPKFSQDYPQGFYVSEYEKTWKDAILQSGDVIVSIEGDSVIPQAMAQQLYSASGSNMELDVIRNGKLVRIVATLSSLKATLEN